MKKIVLIEDDADLFTLLKYNLEKEGFAATGSQTGKGALELCRRVRPDLILLDIMLPDSDGLDICKGIRNDAELLHVPVICGPGTGRERLYSETVLYSRTNRAY
jgi:DNA-binding response OmpR family regulator